MGTSETFGLVLINWDGTWDLSAVQILVIMRRCSYPFGDFVNGKYDKTHEKFEEDMKRRFSLMTAEEKSFISSMNFPVIYFKYWLILPETSLVPPAEKGKYENRKDKFKRTFIQHDNGVQLQSWLNSTKHLELFDLCEFPKGRASNADETPLETAIRETKEETNIHEGLYDILPDVPSIYHSFVGSDDRKSYGRTYFFGRMHKTPRMHATISHNKRNQRLEVDNILWMPLGTLEKMVLLYANVYQRVRNYCMAELMKQTGSPSPTLHEEPYTA